MAGVKKPAKPKYIAKVGLNFDALEPKRRVEAGESLPDGISQSDIDTLLSIKAIEVVEPKKKEKK